MGKTYKLENGGILHIDTNVIPIRTPMKLTQQILTYLKANPPESKRDMCGLVAATQSEPDEIRDALTKLVHRGQVAVRGNGKRHVWEAIGTIEVE